MNKKSFLIVLAIVGVFTLGWSNGLLAGPCGNFSFSLSTSKVTFTADETGVANGKTVTITNTTGCSILDLCYEISGDDTDFTHDLVCSSLLGGSTRDILITFEPNSTGEKKAFLTITTALAENQTITIIGDKSNSSSDTTVEDDSDDEDGCGSIGNAATHKGRNNRIIPPFLSLIVMTMIPLGFILFFRRRRNRL